MRAQRVTRLAAVSAVGILMAGGAAIGAAGTASAATPAVHTHVTTNWCGDRGDRWGGGCFDHRFDHNGFGFEHRFDHRFDHNGFGFGDRFDHHGFFVNRGGVLIFVF
ncbi:hypothetical protein OOK36_30710 [Streptomyces sp. NBC_00365]|uniref:hypothetical protein n=1 Tax=Streptomyces sp. NBC_00365 TaxID=2975726 RepID=UPI00224EA5DF|nr:hypothetical protein [Streptomyces sp. NBC_00365]MCX5093181.1 hypothetical protein [Streptomyces sp. NBC_00365]